MSLKYLFEHNSVDQDQSFGNQNTTYMKDKLSARLKNVEIKQERDYLAYENDTSELENKENISHNKIIENS